MRSRTILFTLLFGVGAFALPHLAHAAIPFFGPIIPNAWDRCPANWTGLIIVINRIISLLITLAITAVAPLMIGYAGFLFVVNPVNASGKEQARTVLMHTIVGIIIALAAYLLVEAVMVVLLGSKDKFNSYISLISGNDQNPCLDLAAGVPKTGPGTNAQGIPSEQPSGDEQAVRNTLKNAGVGINHSACPSGSNGQGCTNVGGLRPDTINQAIAIAKAMGITSSCDGGTSCGLVITGGNEPGHANGTFSHGNGYKLDLRTSSALDAVLENFSSVGTRTGDSPGPAYTDKCTFPSYSSDPAGKNQYVRESDHWDIRITSFCDLDSSSTQSTSLGGPTLSAQEIADRADAARGINGDYKVCTEVTIAGLPASQCNRVLAIIGVESVGRTTAVSPKNAYGLMQLRPETAATYGGVTACNGSTNEAPSSACVSALQDELVNIRAGIKYYYHLYSRFGGDIENATAGYNAGEGSAPGDAFAPSVNCSEGYAWQCPTDPGGLKETQNFVANVGAVENALKN